MNSRMAALVLSALAATAASPMTAQPTRDLCSRDYVADDTLIADILHPTYFVRVHELPGEGGARRSVFEAHSSPGAAGRTRPVAEVDRNSTLQITFARGWMVHQPEFEAQLKIDGVLNGTPIQVPGYSVVGKQADSSVVSVRGARVMKALVCPTHSTLDGVMRSLQEVDAAIVRARQEAAQGQQATRRSLAQIQELEWTRVETANSLIRAATKADSAVLEARLTDVDAELERQHRAAGYLKVVNRYSQTAIPSLRTALANYQATLNTLTKPENAPLVHFVAQRTNRDGAQLIATANRLRSSGLDTLATPQEPLSTAALQRRHDTIEEVQAGVKEISEALKDYAAYLTRTGYEMDPAMLRGLKDTEVLLSALDVKPGDRLTLSFTNALGVDGQNRRLDVPIRVARFGWVREVNDSFLFLRRRGANYKRTPNRVTELVSTIKPGEEREVDIPVGVNYQLTPGAALTWSYNDRSHNTVWRWLRPGVGLQVALPRFETRTYTVSFPTGTAAPSIKEETRGNAFDIALGGLVTLFDNSVGISAGRDMMVRERPYYFAFSVSFVSLAKRAAQLLPSGQ